VAGWVEIRPATTPAQPRKASGALRRWHQCNHHRVSVALYRSDHWYGVTPLYILCICNSSKIPHGFSKASEFLPKIQELRFLVSGKGDDILAEFGPRN
jgi:hypothetical protein